MLQFRLFCASYRWPGGLATDRRIAGLRPLVPPACDCPASGVVSLPQGRGVTTKARLCPEKMAVGSSPCRAAAGAFAGGSDRPWTEPRETESRDGSDIGRE